MARQNEERRGTGGLPGASRGGFDVDPKLLQNQGSRFFASIFSALKSRFPKDAIGKIFANEFIDIDMKADRKENRLKDPVKAKYFAIESAIRREAANIDVKTDSDIINQIIGLCFDVGVKGKKLSGNVDQLAAALKDKSGKGASGVSPAAVATKKPTAKPASVPKGKAAKVAKGNPAPAAAPAAGKKKGTVKKTPSRKKKSPRKKKPSKKAVSALVTKWSGERKEIHKNLRYRSKSKPKWSWYGAPPSGAEKRRLIRDARMILKHTSKEAAGGTEERKARGRARTVLRLFKKKK